MFEPQDFSLARLRALFGLAREHEYQPLFYGEEEGRDEKFILWRHDIDIDLSAARRMAEFEAQEGVRATFFFMTRSWFYNLFSTEGEKTVERIARLGHRLGLHCHLAVPRHAPVTDEFVAEKVAQDFSLIETVFGLGVFQRVVSFHNPPAAVLRKSFPTFYSTYSEKFFGEIKYLSDSNRVWREGPPEDWLREKTKRKFSILLHPLIWAESGRTMPEAVASFCRARQKELIARLEEDDVLVG